MMSYIFYKQSIQLSGTNLVYGDLNILKTSSKYTNIYKKNILK